MNTRRRLNGVVVNNKMEKTVVVEITRRYRHPLYRKVVTSHKRVKAHDELACAIGDNVVIVETKPISKTKRWAVEEILKRAARTEDLPEA
jgi:small subunit ribosomal protein S17